MELECTFMKIPHNICVSLDRMRPCVTFDGKGSQIKICKFLKIKEENGD